MLSFPDIAHPFAIFCICLSSFCARIFGDKAKHWKLYSIQCSNTSFSDEEKPCTAFEQGASAVLFILRSFGHYVPAGPTVVHSSHQTLHQALHVAFEKTYVHGTLAQWLTFIVGNEFKIQHLLWKITLLLNIFLHVIDINEHKKMKAKTSVMVSFWQTRGSKPVHFLSLHMKRSIVETFTTGRRSRSWH